MNGRVGNRRNARGVKLLSLLYLALTAASLVLVHGAAYEPAVAFVPLYFVVSAGVTAAIALLLLPTDQFGDGFVAGVYVFYAGYVAMATFLSGGVSSELYLMLFPLLLAPLLHNSWRIGIASLVSVLLFYFLAMMPGILGGETEGPSLTLFRLAVFALVGGMLLAASRNPSSNSAEDYDTDEDGSVLLERVSRELATKKGVQVAVLLVDPGKVDDVELLLERVRARIADPVLLGEGAVFGMVLSGVDDRAVESAARRALAAASSLGAEETRAGGAIYPRDARSPGDLLVAAGRALEAAFEIESPSAIVLAGRATPRPESRYRAARS